MRQRRDLGSSIDNHTSELCGDQLISINGGEDGDLAYIAGYTHVFTTAHFLTFGVSTYIYLINKVL